MDMKNKYKNELHRALIETFGKENVTYVEIQNGWQALFRGVTFTFYTGKKKKVNISRRNTWHFYIPSSEIEFIQAYLITIGMGYFQDDEPEIVYDIDYSMAIDASLTYTTHTVNREFTKTGTQPCIDHLLRKAETIGRLAGADHKSATLLRTVADELKQYL